MRLVCKITGWNTVLPDRTAVIKEVYADGKVKEKVVTQELVSADTHIKYNAKREVWHQIRNTLGLSNEVMSLIEYGMDKDE